MNMHNIFSLTRCELLSIFLQAVLLTQGRHCRPSASVSHADDADNGAADAEWNRPLLECGLQ